MKILGFYKEKYQIVNVWTHYTMYLISGKTLSIRCVVESVANVQYWDLPHSNGQIEVDRRANIPIHTVFHRLVDAVLQIFGYPKEVAITARGMFTKLEMNLVTDAIKCEFN